MSSYDNIVAGKLKLKGKALDVKAGGGKKKKNKRRQDLISEVTENDISANTGHSPHFNDENEEELRVRVVVREDD